jgi:hypothetical protein
MKLSLTIDCYVFLLTNVAPDTKAFVALTKATRLVGVNNNVDEFSVTCSDADAKIFLEAAPGIFSRAH